MVVLCEPDPPVAGDDEAATDEDKSVTIDVLANDSDPDGDLDSTSVRVATTPGSGIGEPCGNVDQYTPADDFFGSDSFTYEVCDLEAQCSTATVAVEVAPVADAPIAVDESVSADEDATIDVDVVVNDVDADDDLDPSTVSIDSDPSFGVVTVNADGSVTYVPDANRNGIDSFVYEVCDDTGLCDTATVTINVRAVNDAPVARNDSAATTRETPVTVDVLANDTDVESTKPTSSIVVSNPAKGTAVSLSDGTIRYTAKPGACGVDTFTYIASDGLASSASATVTITIDCPQLPPPTPPTGGGGTVPPTDSANR